MSVLRKNVVRKSSWLDKAALFDFVSSFFLLDYVLSVSASSPAQLICSIKVHY